MRESSKLSKNIKNSLDEILDKVGADKDIKLFGSSISEFNFDDMTTEQLRTMKRLFLIKLKKLENSSEITIL